MDAAEYKHVVLGLIFLKYISDNFEEKRKKLIASDDDPEDRDCYIAGDYPEKGLERFRPAPDLFRTRCLQRAQTAVPLLPAEGALPLSAQNFLLKKAASPGCRFPNPPIYLWALCFGLCTASSVIQSGGKWTQ